MVLVLCLALAGHACSAPPSLPEPAPATRGDQRRVIYNEISLTRTGCFGTCPIYTVVYRRDGTVTYTGERHVDHAGVHEGRTGKADFADLAQFVERSGLESLDTHYRVPGTDKPTTTVTVTRLDGRTVSVSEYGRSGPPQLWVVQRVIDGMLPDVQWRALAAPNTTAAPPAPTVHGPGYDGVVMVAGAWTPSAADVREFESRLAGYVATPDVQPALQGTRIRQKLANYKRQYWGIIAEGRRALLVSFIYDSSTLAAPEEWRTTAVLLEGDDPPYPVLSGIAIAGGGDKFFRLVYDVESKRFSRLRVNSPI
ncbi:MAG: hypothetical protein JNM38_09895 [Acidobacteria bacterium]|nr:hypothetical protein [Acidobacteriota bacterium]